MVNSEHSSAKKAYKCIILFTSSNVDIITPLPNSPTGN